jgi:hypothetical protein
MKAIVVTDQAAGTAGMTLVERPKPQAAINDVVVQVHASGFVWAELAWPSTWTDRLDRDRTPSRRVRTCCIAGSPAAFRGGEVRRTLAARD